MNYAVLRDELAADPLGRGYSGMSDADAAAGLNTADVTATYERFVTVRTLMGELGPAAASEIVDALEAGAAASPPLARALAMLKEYSQGGGIDLGHPEARSFLDSLVPDVLTADQAQALKSVAERQISRAEQLGLSRVQPRHVAKARSQLGA